MTAGVLPAFGAHRPPEDPQRAARLILSQPRFRVHVAGSRTNVLAAIWEWLQARWDDLARAFAQHVHVGARAEVAAGDVILALALLTVIVMAVRLGAQYVREYSVPAAQHQRRIETRSAARALYAQSLRAAEEGRSAEAIALLFNAALTLLDVRGMVHDDPSRTVNECRRDVLESAPACSEPFDCIAAAFTAAAYAGSVASTQSWEGARDAYERLARLSPGAVHAA